MRGLDIQKSVKNSNTKKRPGRPAGSKNKAAKTVTAKRSNNSSKVTYFTQDNLKKIVKLQNEIDTRQKQINTLMTPSMKTAIKTASQIKI